MSSPHNFSDASVFEKFVSQSSSGTTSSRAAARALNHVTVLGGAMDARLLAALCFSAGGDVQLFSAYAAELTAMDSGITLNGHGPVGRYHVESAASLQKTGSAIRTTTSLDNCIKDSELIFLTGPVHKQRTYAMVLADHLQDGQVLVIPNARTFGALEVSWLLKTGGCTADITIVEMRGLPYWISSDAQANNSVLDLQPTTEATVACLPATRTESTVESLSALLGPLVGHSSVLSTSMTDCSALVEIPALVLGGKAITAGGSKIPLGGVALEENQSFHSLLGAEQLLVAEQLLSERRQVASRLGVRELPSTAAAVEQFAGLPAGQGRRSIANNATAISLIRDGVIGSLAPLEDTATALGLSLPVTKSMIILCGTLLGSDLALAGRHLSNIGIDNRGDISQNLFPDLAALASGAYPNDKNSNSGNGS